MGAKRNSVVGGLVVGSIMFPLKGGFLGCNVNGGCLCRYQGCSGAGGGGKVHRVKVRLMFGGLKRHRVLDVSGKLRDYLLIKNH
jgi:hypothetical protein